MIFYYYSSICQDLGQKLKFFNKTQEFLDMYSIITIKKFEFLAIFLFIYFCNITNYFIYNVKFNMTFAKMFDKIKIKIDRKINKVKYHIDLTPIVVILSRNLITRQNR